MYVESRRLLLEQMPKHSICAEIGVWKGDFSNLILQHTAPAELHLIDPWVFTTAYGRRWYGGKKAQNQADMDVIHDEVQFRFRETPAVRIHRELSAVAADRFPDRFFDWIYIDGNHYYEFVKQDLERYLPKIKPGGIIAGDDFEWTCEELAGMLPIKTAVDEFVANHGLPLTLIGESQYVIQCPRCDG